MAVSTKPIVLITGANRGIGFELARTLARDHNCHILLGSRSPEAGSTAATEFRTQGLSVSPITIDVTEDSSILAAAKAVEEEHGYIDILVNNAGVMLNISLSNDPIIKRAAFSECYNTNVVGSALVTDAFIPLLYKSSLPRIVFISSTLGSVTKRVDPTYVWNEVDFIPYRASKAALNMLAAQYASEYREKGWKVNVVCPGYVKTRMVGFQGHLEVEEAMPRLVDVCLLGKNGSTGTFSDVGGEVPW